MTNAQIDRLLDGDPSFGIVPLIAAKAIKDAVAQKPAAPAPAPVIVLAPAAPAKPEVGIVSVLAVALVSLGAGAGIGYMLSRRS